MSFIVLIICFCLIFILLGHYFNTIAVESNGNRMPVQSHHYSGYTNTHFYYESPSEVNNYLLTDIIRIGRTTFSIGDFEMLGGYLFLIIIAIFLIIQSYKIKKHQEIFKKTKLN